MVASNCKHHQRTHVSVWRRSVGLFSVEAFSRVLGMVQQELAGREWLAVDALELFHLSHQGVRSHDVCVAEWTWNIKI